MLRYFGSIILLVSLAVAGCGNNGDASSGAGASVATDDADSFGICRILTYEQVATVLADHDGGEVVHSGGSMMEGVDSYQCSYTSEANGQYSVLALVVSLASTPELLAKLRPSDFLYSEDNRPEIADGAFINDKMEGELGITVIKGMHKIDMDLSSKDAHSLKQKMIDLAAAIANKL